MQTKLFLDIEWIKSICLLIKNINYIKNTRGKKWKSKYEKNY